MLKYAGTTQGAVEDRIARHRLDKENVRPEPGRIGFF